MLITVGSGAIHRGGRCSLLGWCTVSTLYTADPNASSTSSKVVNTKLSSATSQGLTLVHF